MIDKKFVFWTVAVSRYLLKHVGRPIQFFSGFPLRAWYDDGLSPSGVALQIILAVTSAVTEEVA